MYVLIEGIDGCGKDTQANHLAESLTQIGMNVLPVAEPDEAMPGGKLLRTLLKSGEFPEAHVGLFLANRLALQLRHIKPHLDTVEDGVVISIRSFLSTLVYQQENWPLEWLYLLHREMPVRPHLVFILDLPAEVGLERATKRPGHNEFYERRDTLERVRKRYLHLARPDLYESGPKLVDFLAPGGRVHVINAQKSVETVAAEMFVKFTERQQALIRDDV